MKKYLFIALAALGFAACAEKLDDNNAPHGGEMEESYIAINLLSADVDTRAAEDTYGYEDGTEAERKITSAHFFFFDENGNPFNVLGVPATAPDPANNGINHLQLSLTTSPENKTENISDISNAVLVLNTYKGIYPKKIVAVLNWTPSNKSYSLEDLHGVLDGTLGTDSNGYVMSNSVYMDGTSKVVDAVNITEDNIKKTAGEAKDAPIDIYVERTAAKVVVTANSKVSGNKDIFKVTTEAGEFTPLGGIAKDVYMQILGWELYQDYTTSSLLKNIQNWDVTELGLTWNDIPYFRSYWADSQSTSLVDSFSWKYSSDQKASKGFLTDYGFAVATTSTERNTYTYCCENTNQAVLSSGEIISDPRTKVILKGQLMQLDGTTYSPLEIASWYGNDYAGIEDLKTAVANSLKYTLYYSTDNGVTFHSIKPEHIECVTGVPGTESYEVGFNLSTSGSVAGMIWYMYSSENQYQYIGNDVANPSDNIEKTNDFLENNVEPALVYANGQTYYFVDIEHLGTAGAKYGVVRNHVYQIDINSVKGFGSPVYSGIDFIIPSPEYPEDYEDSYVAAKINILSWKVVKQGVDIVQ